MLFHAELEKVCGKLCSLWSAFNMQDLRFGCELEAPSEDLLRSFGAVVGAEAEGAKPNFAVTVVRTISN